MDSGGKNITEEIPFDIPKTWEWIRLSDICDYIHRGKSPTYGNKQELPIIAQKCNQWDKIYTDKCLFAAVETINKYTQEQYLQIDDIIINSTGTGTVGRTGIIADYIFEKYHKFVADSHITVVRINKKVIAQYIFTVLISPFIQTNIEERCSGSTNQVELATKTICNYLIPVPPRYEQFRIFKRLKTILGGIKDGA